MEINVKISFEERFLGALERLVGVCNCTPATAPASTFPKGEPAQAPAQGETEKVEKVEKPQEEPAQAPAQETVPTETPAYTFEQIQVACANLAREGKRTELGNLIKEFGLASLPDLKEDQYNAFALKLREIGGTI